MSEVIKRMLFGKYDVRSVVIIITVLCVFGYAFATTFCKIPDVNKEQLERNSNFVYLVAGVMVMGYLFSANKNKTDENKPKPPAATTPDAN